MSFEETPLFSFRRSACLAAAVALTACAAALAPAAEASPVVRPAAPSAQVGAAGRSTAAATAAAPTSVRTFTATAASPKTSITCTLTAHNPTYGGPVYGQYGTSTVQCTANVQSIYLITALYYENSLYVDSVTQTGGGTAASANGATQYSNSLSGPWTTGAVAMITYPSGYTPATQNLGEVYSSTVNLQ
ncbi:hypothetical protein [Streptacidiphilus cavernicola]|uniref:Spore coat protein U domain-containing protein n=1 Tax=Streptacidiphilus cavernicola TaxID=3342716 RepID=A0ABV6VP31_9ACTN